MTVSSTTHSATDFLGSASRNRRGQLVSRIVRFVRRKPLGAIGAAILLVFGLAAILAPVVAPYGPNEQITGARLQAPSGAHLFGTDQLGRDLLSRIIYGARISLAVGLVAVTIGTGLGTLLGMISGFSSNKIDLAIQRFIDGLMAFPAFIMAMVIVTMLGPGLVQVSFAIGVLQIPFVTRVVRSSTLEVKSQTYTEAALALGVPTMRMLTRYVLPNVMPSVIVLATLALGGAILAEAALSFLGLGQGPQVPSWGQMLSNQARIYMLQAPWLAIWPGIAITLAVLSFNLFGDALRDVLDPRLRGQ